MYSPIEDKSHKVYIIDTYSHLQVQILYKLFFFFLERQVYENK